MADDILKEAKEAFAKCQDHWKDNHEEYKKDIKFARLSQQWNDKVRQQREAERRPCLTINKLQPIIRQVVNDARQNRPAIKVAPADSNSDPETADVISGMIRNIQVSSNADVAYDTAIDNAVSGGLGYWRVNLDYSTAVASLEEANQLGAAAFEKDIVIRRVPNPLSVYGDPCSTEADSSDWNLAFIVDEVKKSEFKARYPDAKMVDFDAAAWNSLSPPWAKEDKILVAEYWTRSEVVEMAIGLSDGTIMLLKEYEKQAEQFAALGVTANTPPLPIKCYKVKQRRMSGVEELDSTDWLGKYIPVVPVYGDEVNLEGKRYFRSLIRDAKDAQDMFNYWRTAATEIVALAPKAPYIGRKGAFESDQAKWETANNATHAYIEYDGPEMPQRQPFAGVPAGMIQEALNASDDIKAITGIFDASLGARSNETSGKAIMARQREGDVSTFHLIDNLTRAIRHTGLILIDLIPKVYPTERIVRILGEDGTPESKQINKEYEDKDEKTGEPLVKIHDVRTGKYDITVTSGPSFTSRREEAATMMTEMVRAYPDIAPFIIDLIAKNFDWPFADEIAKRAEAMLPPQIKGEDPEAQQRDAMAQQQMQMLSGELQKVMTDLQALKASRDIDQQKLILDRMRVDIDAYKAETDRMQALHKMATPDPLPGGEEGDQPTGAEPELEETPA